MNNNNTTTPQLKRALTNRHIQLIAIGGAIGTGLFMGSGKTISLAGPSIIFVYASIGVVLFFVMRAMGELLLSNLSYRTFSDFAADLLGPWAGFFVGWTYWFCWIVTGIADVVTISGYLEFWLPGVAHWKTSLTCVFFLMALNLTTVRMFGEIEFWFSMIKIVAIMTLIVIGFGLIIYGYQTPTGNTASLTNLWQHGGMFPNGMSGFFAGFQIAIFAFVGIELVGTTAAEAVNPEKTLPRAINAIPIRVVTFYVLSLVIIMAVTPWSQLEAKTSPFVHMFSLVGLMAAAGVVNFVVTTSAASSCNSGVFSTSRMLFGLSRKGMAPKVFGFLSRRYIPAAGLIFSCLCLLSGALLNYFIKNIVTVFTLVTTISAVLFMFVWTIFLLSYLKYRRSRPHLHAQSKFKMPFGIFMCWFSLAFFAFIIGLLTLKTDTRNALLFTPVWFIGLSIAWQFNKKPAISKSTTSS